jgi:hypothetical protein
MKKRGEGKEKRGEEGEREEGKRARTDLLYKSTTL